LCSRESTTRHCLRSCGVAGARRGQPAAACPVGCSRRGWYVQRQPRGNAGRGDHQALVGAVVDTGVVGVICRGQVSTRNAVQRGHGLPAREPRQVAIRNARARAARKKGIAVPIPTVKVMNSVAHHHRRIPSRPDSGSAHVWIATTTRIRSTIANFPGTVDQILPTKKSATERVPCSRT
jgi:hypothetical protein